MLDEMSLHQNVYFDGKEFHGKTGNVLLQCRFDATFHAEYIGN